MKNCLEGYLTPTCAACEFWHDGTPDENGNTSIGCGCPFPIDRCEAFHKMYEENEKVKQNEP